MALFDEIKKIQDAQRLLLTKANFMSKRGELTKEVADLYLQAAGMCVQIADLSTGFEVTHQLEMKDKYEKQAKDILAQIQQERLEQQRLEQERLSEERLKKIRLEEEERIREQVRRELMQEQEHASGINLQRTTQEIKVKEESVLTEEPIQAEDNTFTLQDVAGMQALKERLMQFIDDGLYSQTQEKLGIGKLKAMLFYGLPGCGKTHIVNSFAGEVSKQYGYQFIRVEGKDIIGKYAGQSEKKVAEVIDKAIENAPCILFVDEFDGVCKNRELAGESHWVSALTTSFLIGFEKLMHSNKPIILLGATNYPDYVDNAMLNRMELVRVPMPDRAARIAFFEQTLKKMSLVAEISAGKMAALTEGYDYRDMKHVIAQIQMSVMKMLRTAFDTDEEAAEALERGYVAVDETLFREALSKVTVLSKEIPEKKLQLWEASSGLLPEANSEKKTELTNDISEKTEETKENKVIWSKYYGFWSGEGIDYMFADEIAESDDIAHNPTPKANIESAFYYHSAAFAPERESYIETCFRYLRTLEDEVLEEDALTEEGRNRIAKMADLIAALEATMPVDEIRNFYGLEGEVFKTAYKRMITKQQGNEVDGFWGTCGICSSATAVNQQTGSLITEGEAVKEFIQNRLCTIDPYYLEHGTPNPDLSDQEKSEVFGSNGGTSVQDRIEYLESKGLQTESVVIMYPEEQENLVTLEMMEERFRLGQSIIFRIHAEDMQFGEEVTKLDAFRRKAKIVNANHCITVAGFSYDNAGNILGVWMNDTGGFGSYIGNGQIQGTNRIYLERQVFDNIKKRTRRFGPEFVWRDK